MKLKHVITLYVAAAVLSACAVLDSAGDDLGDLICGRTPGTPTQLVPPEPAVEPAPLE